MIDLQCHSELKFIFTKISIIEFYEKYVTNDKFPNLKKFAVKIISSFATISHCESLFSKMKISKNKFCNLIMDQNVESQLRIATTKIEVVFDELSKNKCLIKLNMYIIIFLKLNYN